MNDRLRDTPRSQGPEITQHEFAPYNVLAVFEDIEGARVAIEELGRAGISGQAVTLQGPAPDEAATHTDTAASDGRMMKHWVKAVAQFAAAGAAIGAVLGIATMLAFGMDVTAGSVGLAVGVSALGLATALGLVGSMYRMQDSETWELTFQEASGRAVVGIHSDDEKDVAQARNIFESGKALEVRSISESSGDPARIAYAMAREATSRTG